MYPVEYLPNFQREFSRLWSRNPVLAQAIENKILRIREHPEHFKPLRGPLKGLRRVHFGSYVLLYRFFDGVVYLVALDHHDDAYDQ
jgi:mRNA-degrading endonuclease RelE of RelBE toxin-antitoxin system